jgi:hypothetical protein
MKAFIESNKYDYIVATWVVITALYLISNNI